MVENRRDVGTWQRGPRLPPYVEIMPHFGEQTGRKDRENKNDLLPVRQVVRFLLLIFGRIREKPA
jgi:hypothetical protein